MAAILPCTRPEIESEQLDSSTIGVIEKPISTAERIWNQDWVRKAFIIIFLAVLWQAYAVWKNNQLVFPTFADTVKAFVDSCKDGVLPARMVGSLKLLLGGYGIGLALAGIMTVLAISTRFGNDLLETLTSMFNPLPAIALLPLAMLWFGLGNISIIFVTVHSVLWPVALNTHSGFRSVSNTLRMVGKNYGLGGFNYVFKILIPGAFPSILAGMKIGWAFAWRTLIAAELVYGANTGGGGLGWYIFENKNTLEIPAVFAGLLTVIIIGLIVENLVFRVIERRTVRKWGMQA